MNCACDAANMVAMNKVAVMSTGTKPQLWLPVPNEQALVMPSSLSSAPGEMASDKSSWESRCHYVCTRRPYWRSSLKSDVWAGLMAAVTEYEYTCSPFRIWKVFRWRASFGKWPGLVGQQSASLFCSDVIMQSARLHINGNAEPMYVI